MLDIRRCRGRRVSTRPGIAMMFQEDSAQVGQASLIIIAQHMQLACYARRGLKHCYERISRPNSHAEGPWLA